MEKRILTNKEIERTVGRLGKEYINLCDAFRYALEEYGDFKFSTITAKDPLKGIMLCHRVNALVIYAQCDVTFNYGNLRDYIRDNVYKFVGYDYADTDGFHRCTSPEEVMILDVIERLTKNHDADEFWRLFSEYFRSGAYNKLGFEWWVIRFKEDERRMHKEVKESVASYRFFRERGDVEYNVDNARDAFLLLGFIHGWKNLTAEVDWVYEHDGLDDEQYKALLGLIKEKE